MNPHYRHNKSGKKHNDLIISDDIDTTESYAGVGQLNIVNSDKNIAVTTQKNYISKLQDNEKSKNTEAAFLNDIKVSPELEFNIPTRNDLRNNVKKNSDFEKNTVNNGSRSSARIQTSGNVTSLPLLTLKKPLVDRDLNQTKSKTINGQIEKIEHRKEKLTLSEKKNRMSELRMKSKQNWSNFRSDIEFIKSVEMSNSNTAYESVNIIKDEKVFNNILNELCSTDSDNTTSGLFEHIDSLIPNKGDISPILTDDNQESTAEFISTIRPMLKSYISSPLTEEVAMVLKQVIFSSTCRTWGTEWYRQNFEFFPQDSALPFALIQKMEGPNSVMCAVQAEFLIDAIFYCDVSVNWICNLKRNRNQLLANTLTRIISRCRSSKTDTFHICLLDVNLKRRSLGSVKLDGITECIIVFQISTQDDLQKFILHNISQFTDIFSPGLILLLISCLLTHGLLNITLELNKDDRRLISPLGFPRDELMKLMITGSIGSHYFNDTVQCLDDAGCYTSVRGVFSRSTVGYLSTERHCEYCKEIGTYLKTPKYPIWLAKLEENNFIVLYCLNGNLVNDWKTEIKFQLNMYSPLFAKRGVIKMTIDSSVSKSEKVRITEEESQLAKEKERKQNEDSLRRLKTMSDSALKFLLHEETIEDYLNNNETSFSQSKDEMNILEKVIVSKWPNATVVLSDENTDIFSLIKN